MASSQPKRLLEEVSKSTPRGQQAKRQRTHQFERYWRSHLFSFPTLQVGPRYHQDRHQRPPRDS
eukprot:1002688-Pyramimonas_sp.AAC.1